MENRAEERKQTDILKLLATKVIQNHATLIILDSYWY